MHSCEDFVLTLRAGFFHNEGYVTKTAITASDLGIREGSDFEILLGGADEAAIPIPQGVMNASIREYYFDWRPAEPAVFTIECLDPPAPGRIAAAEIVARVQAARTHVIDSMEFWHDYMEKRRSEQSDNAFPETLKLAKGLTFGRYELCFWCLEPGEALVIESAKPDAGYWSAQTYLMDTFDLVDRFGRISSRNQRQTRVSDDGRVRWVLAAQDPGVANWLDTGGRRVGLCVVRWFWPRSEQGLALRTRVAQSADVRSHLPADEPSVSPGERAEELGRRQQHLRWRVRS